MHYSSLCPLYQFEFLVANKRSNLVEAGYFYLFKLMAALLVENTRVYVLSANLFPWGWIKFMSMYQMDLSLYYFAFPNLE